MDKKRTDAKEFAFAGVVFTAVILALLAFLTMPDPNSLSARPIGNVDLGSSPLDLSEDFESNFLKEDDAEPHPDQNSETLLVSTFGRGELRLKDGLPLLVLRGSFYDMGMQYGFLAGSEIAAMLGVFDEITEKESSGFLSRNIQIGVRRWLGKLFERHFPESAQNMISGIREGASLRGIDLNEHDLAFLNSVIDIAGIGSTDLSFSSDGLGAVSALVGLIQREVGASLIRQNCNTFAAWGSRTHDGKTFQTRNTDIAVGLGLERHPLVYAAFPEDASGPLVPYVAAGFAGQIGASTGMNAHGVALGQVWAFSRIKAIGSPWSLLMIDVMSQAKSATEAADLLLASRPSPHTYGNNFVFADAVGDGVAVELNPHNSDRFRAADPREASEAQMEDGRIWALPLRDAIVRADFSMSRKIRKDQTSAGGPQAYPPTAGSYRKRYAGQIKRILALEAMGRPIGVREAMMISRATADRNTGNIQLAVYANTDRRLWVSYASERRGVLRQAFENSFVLIPFDALLKGQEATSPPD